MLTAKIQNYYVWLVDNTSTSSLVKCVIIYYRLHRVHMFIWDRSHVQYRGRDAAACVDKVNTFKCCSVNTTHAAALHGHMEPTI